jgi:hypothetical protein
MQPNVPFERLKITLSLDCVVPIPTDMPLHLWDKLLPQALITLNLLRGSRMNPKRLDFNGTPLAPPGTKVLIHEKPEVRGTWAPHAVDGWYLGPALNHYRCYRVWIHETTSERVVDTLSWLPSYFTLPGASAAEAATAAAQYLIKALLSPPDASPTPTLTDSTRQALYQLADIFCKCNNANNNASTNRAKCNDRASPNPHNQTSFVERSVQAHETTAKQNTIKSTNINEAQCISEGGSSEGACITPSHSTYRGTSDGDKLTTSSVCSPVVN